MLLRRKNKAFPDWPTCEGVTGQGYDEVGIASLDAEPQHGEHAHVHHQALGEERQLERVAEPAAQRETSKV